MKKNVLSSVVCLVMLFGMSGLAFAHAHLVSSHPAADAVVHGPAIAVNLKFDSRVDGARSRLDLVYPNGNVEPLTMSKQLSPSEFGSRINNLAPGKYIIRWQALAVDGHLTRGEVPFTVR